MTSSDDEQNNPYYNGNTRSYIPLYRKEHGGIVIYDVDGNIPGQPAPPYDGSDDEADNEGKPAVVLISA